MTGHDRDTAPGRPPRLGRQWLPSRMYRWNGRYAARSVYGSVVVLAVLMTLEDHPPPPVKAALVVAGTVLSVLAAEAYSDQLGREIDLRRRLTRAERLALLRDLGFITLAAEGPVLVLLLAAVDLVSEDRAFDIAIWLTIVLMGLDGCLARRLAGFPTRACVVGGVAVGGVGVALAVFKSFVH
jgi:hypothetical protein